MFPVDEAISVKTGVCQGLGRDGRKANVPKEERVEMGSGDRGSDVGESECWVEHQRCHRTHHHPQEGEN